MKYNVYLIDSRTHYTGLSLVAASSAEEANSIIQEFRQTDLNNRHDSYGYDNVSENDIIENLYSDRTGIILYGIYYIG